MLLSIILHDIFLTLIVIHVNSVVTNIQDNILYYISGFIEKVISKLDVRNLESLLQNKDNKNINYDVLRNSKDRGGLFLVSDCVYKIVKATEKHEFITHGIMLHKMPNNRLF